MTWLVTGGAGYIGGHVVRALRASGRECLVLDDLSTGLEARVPQDVPVVRARVDDDAAVRAAVREHGVTGVIHLAAKKSPAESVADPLRYYRENVGGLEALLTTLVALDVRRLVFSSSAAVYGVPTTDVVTEDAAIAPINPYGTTKAIGERMSTDVALAHGMDVTLLRYFNVAGAGAPHLADVGVFNLVPLALRAVAQGQAPLVFGADYPTPDGTGVRDYIHVEDLAEAHVAAAATLESREPAGAVATYNVGRGAGHSVLEVLDTVRRVTGSTVAPEIRPRRAGDPASVVGDPGRIGRELGWFASRDLEQMITSAWAAWPHATGTAG